MRRTANLYPPRWLLVVAGSLAIVSISDGARAEDAAKDAGTLVAILHPVDRDTGAIDEDISLGSARFSPAGGKTQIILQVDGISIAGSEEGVAADGTGNVYPRVVQIVPAACPAAAKGASGGERLPDLPVRDNGSGIMFASTATGTAKLAGQSVLISKPSKPGAATGVPAACGVIGQK
jgi:hypothetical protein